MPSFPTCIKALLGLLSCYCCFATVQAQDIGNLKKQKPYTLSGSIGASASFYNSNEPVATRPGLGWNIYGNLTPTIYGVSLPLSFVITQYSKSYTQPFTMFGLSPTYKWAKLHLGYRSISFSPVTFDGQSFRGVGLELNPRGFRFAAFYGKLNRKVNEDTSAGRFIQPQFSRIGYGIKIGVGNATNFFDLIYFHAKDDSTSAKVISKTGFRPQENTVLGSSFRFILAKKLVFSTDLAISGLKEDIAQPDSLKISDWAGQSTLQLILKGYNTTLGYRRVAPDFKSLGTPYMLNDVALVNWLNNFILSGGKLNITTTLSSQHNNLDKRLATEMQTVVGNISANAQLSQRVNLNINYSGYQLKQKDGTLHLTDSVRMNQVIHQLSLVPSFTIAGGLNAHTISGNICYMLLDDKNPVTTAYTSSNNLSTSINYTLGLAQKSMSFTLSGMYSRYNQDTNSYRSYGTTIGSMVQLLKSKALSLQGSMGYMFNTSSFGSVQNNLTFSCNAGYHLKHHSLALYANYIYTPYNPINTIINKQVAQAVASKNLAGGISYNYSF